MTLLAIDTSTRQLGVAVFDGTRVLNEMSWTSPFHHTVELAPSVELALQRAGLSMPDIDAVGAALGPGSFTALRSGLAFAKGLTLMKNLPLVGVPSLDVVAAAQPASDLPLLAVLEAGRRRLAVGAYRYEREGWVQAGDPGLMTIEELAESLASPTLVAGELSPDARHTLEAKPHARPARPFLNVRRPAVLAELAWQRWQAGRTDDPGSLAPIYLSEGITE